jgi:cytochrome c nitrite reductase small subunit
MKFFAALDSEWVRMKKVGVVRALLPWILLERIPLFWRLAIFIMLGTAAGAGAGVFHLSRAASYLSTEAETCINCHVMTDAYASWKRGSHGHAAVCVDCHLPHTNPIATYAAKSRDGGRHTAIFVLRKEPQVFHLAEYAEQGVQENCLRCHANQFQMTRLASVAERACWDCHRNIHGSVRSMSASPAELRPRLPAAGWNPLSFFQRER